jgi:hypothetical protein
MTMTRNMYHVVWVVGLLGLIAFSSGCSEPHNKGSQIFNPDTGRQNLNPMAFLPARNATAVILLEEFHQLPAPPATVEAHRIRHHG